MAIRRITLAGFAAIGLATGAAAQAETDQSRADQQVDQHVSKLQPGDILTQRDESGWSTVKIIAVDVLPDGDAVAHCLLYAPTPDRPALDTLGQLKVLALHAPIRAGSFDGFVRLGAMPLTKDEAAGFATYLKQTDFKRYAKYTGQNLDALISRANRHYAAGNTLGDAGRREAAIAEYDKAVDLFPLFFEAIDNRAFVLMELSRYREALKGFEQSLEVNPEGLSAFFSKGECLMQLGELDAAEAVFVEGQTRFPEKRQLFAEFVGKVRAMRARMSP